MYYLRVGGQYVGGGPRDNRWVDRQEDATALTVGNVVRQLLQIADPESNLNHMTVTLIPVNRTRLGPPMSLGGPT